MENNQIKGLIDKKVDRGAILFIVIPSILNHAILVYNRPHHGNELLFESFSLRFENKTVARDMFGILSETQFFSPFSSTFVAQK